MKRKFQFLTILSISILIFPVVVLAVPSPPGIPLLVYGDVTINGQVAPVDTKISAEIDSIEVATVNIANAGRFFIEVPDGKVNEGKMITFKVNGIINSLQLKCANIDTTPSVNFNLTITTTRPCSISNGQGIQTWDGSSWGDCIVESCNDGYHQEGNSCIVDSTGGGGGGGGGGGSSYTPPTTPSSTTRGDINGDDKVDKYDFALMMAAWEKTGVNSSDLNGDNKVDKYDFALLMLNWS